MKRFVALYSFGIRLDLVILDICTDLGIKFIAPLLTGISETKTNSLNLASLNITGFNHCAFKDWSQNKKCLIRKVERPGGLMMISFYKVKLWSSNLFKIQTSEEAAGFISSK